MYTADDLPWSFNEREDEAEAQPENIEEHFITTNELDALRAVKDLLNMSWLAWEEKYTPKKSLSYWGSGVIRKKHWKRKSKFIVARKGLS
ncbi:hypothetical protein IC620_15950 [Hazenella sp. IB182357]|uniref:Uncharacterized protein n=1 Tax=Polycladospora coralii TaxID=2771432 RepID=A0A926NC14_9BACL|nr:hypothetical protein [Polycladospora coralii]MBD1373838.1 hypothetical protein [Polycladospora coralii]